MKKLYTSKAFSKTPGVRMHIAYPSYPTPLGPSLAISYKNHQKSQAYFSHLAPLIFVNFLLKDKVKKRGRMAQHLP